MKKCLIIGLAIISIVVSCTKKPLTLDDQTSMKTLLKASDEEITELVKKEAEEYTEFSGEDINVDYILRDKEGQAIVVKVSTTK